MTFFLARLFSVTAYSEYDGLHAMRRNYVYQMIRYKDYQGTSSELLILAQVQMVAKLRNPRNI
jgi:hypothetical protein